MIRFKAETLRRVAGNGHIAAQPLNGSALRRRVAVWSGGVASAARFASYPAAQREDGNKIEAGQYEPTERQGFPSLDDRFYYPLWHQVSAVWAEIRKSFSEPLFINHLRAVKHRVSG